MVTILKSEKELKYLFIIRKKINNRQLNNKNSSNNFGELRSSYVLIQMIKNKQIPINYGLFGLKVQEQ